MAESCLKNAGKKIILSKQTISGTATGRTISSQDIIMFESKDDKAAYEAQHESGGAEVSHSDIVILKQNKQVTCSLVNASVEPNELEE